MRELHAHDAAAREGSTLTALLADGLQVACHAPPPVGLSRQLSRALRSPGASGPILRCGTS